MRTIAIPKHTTVGSAGAAGRSPDPEDFERLDRLVRDLVARFQTLQREHTTLRDRLEERERRLRRLDEELLALNQSRRDAGKRIDDLIAQLERIDVELERRLAAEAEDDEAGLAADAACPASPE